MQNTHFDFGREELVPEAIFQIGAQVVALVQSVVCQPEDFYPD